MDVKRKVNRLLSSKTMLHRCLALFLCLSIFVSYGIPLSAVKKAYAANESVVPSGSYEINSDITNITVDSISGGTYDSATNTITVDSGLDQVEFNMSVNFTIPDYDHDRVDTNKPYIHLKVPRSQLNIFAMNDSGAGLSSDLSHGWQNYVRDHNLSSDASGQFTIYDTGEDDYGYVVLEFNNDYINYLKSSNGIIIGTLAFNGQVTRENLQNGDKTVNLGNAGINVDFDDRTPDASKSGNISGYDNAGCPEITWTINVSDLYETNNYHITDDMLGEIIDGSFSCNPDGICFLQNG